MKKQLFFTLIICLFLLININIYSQEAEIPETSNIEISEPVPIEDPVAEENIIFDETQDPLLMENTEPVPAPIADTEINNTEINDFTEEDIDEFEGLDLENPTTVQDTVENVEPDRPAYQMVFGPVGFGISNSGLDFLVSYGNGKLFTIGAAYSLFGGLLIPELSLGYTPIKDDGFFEVKHQGVSVCVVMYSKFVEFILVPDMHIYLGVGADFSYFSESGKIVSGLFFSQGYEALNLDSALKNIAFEIRESLYFEQSNPGFFTFQVGFGLRFGFFGD